jgi:hypothetical protein
VAVRGDDKCLGNVEAARPFSMVGSVLEEERWMFDLPRSIGFPLSEFAVLILSVALPKGA